MTRPSTVAFLAVFFFVTPANAEDQLTTVLAAVPADNCGSAAGAARLSCAQRKAQAAAESLELFATRGESLRDRAAAADGISPELRPFFKDRASSLNALYRTLAVLDYTAALRDGGDACRARARRGALLSAPDGLFTDPKTGNASAWIERLVGPAALKKTSEAALDEAGASVPSPRDAAGYARLRARARRLSEELLSAGESAGRRCGRAKVYEALAAADAEQGGAVLASRDLSPARRTGRSVLLLAHPGDGRIEALGAATAVETTSGTFLVTDARLVVDAQGRPRPGLEVAARDGAGLGRFTSIKFTRVDTASGLAEGPVPAGVSGLRLASRAPAEGALMSATAQSAAAGYWGRTTGLVTRSSGDWFETDAAADDAMSGGAVTDADGALAGLLVLRRAADGRPWPAAVSGPALARWLAGGEVGAFASSGRGEGTASLVETGLAEGQSVQDADCNGETTMVMGQAIHAECAADCTGCGAPAPALRPATPQSSAPSAPAGPDWAQIYGAQMGRMIGQYFGNVLTQALFGGGPAGPAYAAPVAPSAPPKPKKPQDELKITGLRLTVSPSAAKLGDSVEVTAQLLFSDEDYPDKANVDVDLSAPEGTYFIDRMAGQGLDAAEEGDRNVTLQTDASGRARARLRIEKMDAAQPRVADDSENDDAGNADETNASSPLHLPSSVASAGLVILATAQAPNRRFQARAVICSVGASGCGVDRSVADMQLTVSPSGPLRRDQSVVLSATVKMSDGGGAPGVKVAFRGRDAGDVRFATGDEATAITDEKGVARVTGRLWRAIPAGKTEEEVKAEVKDAPEGGAQTAGVSAAAVVLIATEESDDCPIKPGEDPLRRFVDKTGLAPGYLEKHEGPDLGHTIERHVAKSLAYLTHRVVEEKYEEASTFNDLPTAENIIRSIAQANGPEIVLWFNSPNSRAKSQDFEDESSKSADSPIGILISATNPDQPQQCYKARIVLRRKGRCDIFILTAYPKRQ